MFSRPPAFAYKNEKLHCEQLPLDQLAEKYGTPLYVYSATAIRQRFRLFDQAFRTTPHTICYAVKANSNLSLLRMLAKMGAGFDIVSGGELERIRLANSSAVKRVVFSGVGKATDEINLALRCGILLFNVESFMELEMLAQCASRLRRKARLALRVNPDVPAQTHPYISTGLREHKFGVPMSEARELYKWAAAQKFLQVAGVSLHIGSQITDVSPFGIAVQRAADLVRQLTADDHKIEFLDAGGGLGISYDSSHPIEFADQVKAYAEAVTRALRDLGKLRPHLLLEPGRSIVAAAGALVTKILYNKHNQSKTFTIVDAAMNDLLRPALYSAKHEITPVSREHGSAMMHSDVVGPVCETGDFLARDVSLPPSKPDEYLCVLDAGAYGMSLASNYNTRPRAAEVMVEGKKARLVRRRETLKGLLQEERACL
jgi:diaminopimelate decarboxylase